MSPLPTHQPASLGKRGIFCACLPPPAPAQGSSVLERGMWGGRPWDLSVTHHRTGLTPSPPVRCLYTPFPKPILPHLRPHPGPHQPGLSPVPLAHLVAVRLSLWVSLHLSRPVCLCVSFSAFLLRPPLFAVLSHRPFPTCPHPWLASSPHAGSLPLSVRPNLPRLWPGGTHPSWRGGLGRAALALALA